MSAWRRELIERFPEFGLSPESWGLVDAEIKLGSLLNSAARAADRETAKRVLDFVLWAASQTAREEKFTYFCQDVLRATVTASSLRPFLVSLLNGRTFAQLVGLFEYLTTKEVVLEMANELHPKRHAR